MFFTRNWKAEAILSNYRHIRVHQRKYSSTSKYVKIGQTLKVKSYFACFSTS